VFLETARDVPEAQSLRVENKMFYFDVGQNRRGSYMRISEVSTFLLIDLNDYSKTSVYRTSGFIELQ